MRKREEPVVDVPLIFEKMQVLEEICNTFYQKSVYDKNIYRLSGGAKQVGRLAAAEGG